MKTIFKLLNEEKLFFISLGIVSYFAFLYLIDIYDLGYTIINVFAELFTLPLLLLQQFFLAVGILFLIKKKTTNVTYLTIISILILGICTIVIIGSFIK